MRNDDGPRGGLVLATLAVLTFLAFGCGVAVGVWVS